MLTVLHSESSTGWGGQENRTLNEARQMARLGVRVLLLTRPGAELGKRAAAEGFPVHEAAMRSNADLATIVGVARLIQREQVDIVNTHSGRDSFLVGAAGRLAPRRPRIVRTRHLALPITTTIGYSLLPHHVVTVSRHVRAMLVERGVPDARISAIPTGVDLSRFDGAAGAALREELGIAAGRPVIGTVAILRKKKGHAFLLEAIPQVLAEFPAALFLFAGDGPQRANIERRVGELGLGDNVRLLGLRRDLPNVLAGIDLFVLPTLQEALGTSFIEAMAMGRPVVGSAVDGVPEVVRHGVNGLLVPPAEPAALAAAIIDLLRDPQRCAALGEAGRRIARDEYSVEVMGEAMLALYRRLMTAR